MNNYYNYFKKFSNNVSYTYLIIVARFQFNSIIIFEVIKKSLMPRLALLPPPAQVGLRVKVSYLAIIDQAITGIWSDYNQLHKDRVFFHRCDPVPLTSAAITISGTKPLNHLYGRVEFQCPRNYALTGKK